MVRAFCAERLLQFPVAKRGSVLIRKAVLGKSTVGNTQNELAIPFFGINNEVGVVAAIRLQLEPGISNLDGHSDAAVGEFRPPPGKPAGREPKLKVPSRVLLRSLPEAPWGLW